MNKADCTCGAQSREGTCRYCRELFHKWSWKQRNKDKVRAYDEYYRQTAPGKLSARRSASRYRDRNPEKVREWERHRQWRGTNEKTRARSKVAYALAQGVLTRAPCEVCGTETRVEAHHPDYAQPLEMVWLCDSHHREIHWPLPS